MQRIRIYYAKNEAARYTGNLDIHKIWERWMRRAHLPLAYSQGFHPQPRINQACPLPLGITSEAEIIETWFEEDLPLDEIARNLVNSAPPGISIHHLETVDASKPSIVTTVQSAEYQITMLDSVDLSQIRLQLEAFLTAHTFQRERRGKTYDLRPLVLTLVIDPEKPSQPISIRMLLSAREGATGRPDEVLSAIGIDPLATRIHRTKLNLSL